MASEVSTLTDARFFSAIGASWLGHFPERTALTEAEFGAIQSWVTGPEWVLEQEIHNDAGSLMNRLGIELLKVGKGDEGTGAHFVERSLQTWLDMDLDIELEPRYWIIEIDEMPSEYHIVQLKRSAGIHAIFLKAPALETHQILYLIGKIQPHGLVLKGSREKKTGLKSYEAINEILEGMEAHKWI